MTGADVAGTGVAVGEDALELVGAQAATLNRIASASTGRVLYELIMFSSAGWSRTSTTEVPGL
jgi:hypothetical protein